MTTDQILRKIEGLQKTRNYADEVESARLTAIIAQLFKLLETAR
jgi:hypothetical protein